MGLSSLWPVVQGFEDDQQIYVAVGAGVATGMTAEEDDLFGIEAFGNHLGYQPVLRALSIGVSLICIMPLRTALPSCPRSTGSGPGVLQRFLGPERI